MLVDEVLFANIWTSKLESCSEFEHKNDLYISNVSATRLITLRTYVNLLCWSFSIMLGLFLQIITVNRKLQSTLQRLRTFYTDYIKILQFQSSFDVLFCCDFKFPNKSKFSWIERSSDCSMIWKSKTMVWWKPQKVLDVDFYSSDERQHYNHKQHLTFVCHHTKS